MEKLINCHPKKLKPLLEADGDMTMPIIKLVSVDNDIHTNWRNNDALKQMLVQEKLDYDGVTN